MKVVKWVAKGITQSEYGDERSNIKATVTIIPEILKCIYVLGKKMYIKKKKKKNVTLTKNRNQ